MKYYPKLIKKEFMVNFNSYDFWFQSLAFKVLRIMRKNIKTKYSLKTIKYYLLNYLKIKVKAKMFYILINSKKPIEQRKSPKQINEEFKTIEYEIKENLWTVQKDFCISKLGKGIQKIKDKVDKTKKYFTNNLTILPPEICEHILTFVFIW